MDDSAPLLHVDWIRWFQALKTRVELPVSAGTITGGQALTRANDTNVTLTLGGTPATALLAATSLTLGWTGTLAAARLNANVVQSVVNDTNVTGSIAAQALTLGWTGELAVTRGGNGLTALATGDLWYGSAANTASRRAIGSAADVLTVSGGGLPVWAAPAAAATSVIVDDTTTNATMFPTWVTAVSGSLPLKVTSTKLSFNPSTGLLLTTALTASGAIIADTPTLVVDAVNHRIGIGNASPVGKLQVDGSLYVASANGSIDYAACVGALNTAEGGIGYNVIFGTSFTYGLNDFASFFDFPAGGIRFLTAPSGVAGGAISFTTRAAISQVGNFSLGITGSVADARMHVGSSQSGKTTLGASRAFILENTDGGVSTGDRLEIGLGYGGFAAVTYQPMVLGHIVTSLGDVTKGDFYIASRDVTTDSAPTERVRVTAGGLVGIGVSAPTAFLHLLAGTATANTAPLKFTSGTNLTTAEAGAMEYNGTNLFFTRAGTVREYVDVSVPGVAAPGTSIGVGIVNYYGTAATNFLGDPNAWESVNYGGTVYKRPLYT